MNNLNNMALFCKLGVDGFYFLSEEWEDEPPTGPDDTDSDWPEAHAAFQEDIYDPDWEK